MNEQPHSESSLLFHVVVILLAIVIGVAAFLEIALAIPLGWVFYLSVGLLSLLVVVPLAWKLRPVLRVSVPVGFLICLLALQVVPWNSRKTFLDSLNKIENNMTPIEVEAIMAGHIEAYRTPSLVTYRHTDHGRFDSDVALIHYHRERVIKVDFLPD